MRPVQLLLFVEEADSGRLLDALADGGCRVQLLSRAAELELALRVERPDAVLFDPGVAGSDFLTRMRRQHPSQTLVAWLPRPSSAGVAELLEAGADEALHGGMAAAELLARIRSAVRRGGRPVSSTLELGPLTIDPAHGLVTWQGRELSLTRREREVLHALAESAGHTVRREDLYRLVWGYTMARGDRSVDVNVRRLRNKLAEAADSLEIKTQPGIGYRLELRLSQEAPQPASDLVTGL